MTFLPRWPITPRATATGLWALAWLVAALLSWLIPPMQSPDEMSHIHRAYLISQGTLLLQPWPADLAGPVDNPEAAAFIKRARQHGGRVGGPVDKTLLDYADAYLMIAREADKRLSATEKNQLAQLNWSDQQRFYVMPGTGYYFPAIYAPQALGLAIGRTLGLSIERSYQLARISILLVCFTLLSLACRLTVPNPLVAAMLLLPMSVFQLVLPTIDGLTMALSVLAASLFLRSADLGRKHSSASSWALATCLFLLATSRTHLLPLLAMPFYISWRRSSRRDFYLGCGMAAAALVWVLFALIATNDPRIVRSHTTTQLLMHYASHPAAFFKVVFASLGDTTLSTFYQESFVGILGWLDTRLTAYFYPVLWAGLALCGLVSVSASTLRQDWSARLLLAAMSLASVGLIFLALLVTWTPHPTLLVQGVQGRYFLVPMILLGFVASGFGTASWTLQSPLRRWLAGLVFVSFALTSLTALILTLLRRYH